MLIPTTIVIIMTTVGTKNHASHCRVPQVSPPLRDLALRPPCRVVCFASISHVRRFPPLW